MENQHKRQFEKTIKGAWLTHFAIKASEAVGESSIKSGERDREQIAAET